jgi:drug/metabolite transporter (DMT)-like permease
MAVVLVPVFLAVFWKRKIGGVNAIGVASAFGGLYLLTVPASGRGSLNLESIGWGDLLTLGAAVVFAFHII